MARKTRKQILYDGCYAHIMSRAVDGRFIFKDEEDFGAFRDYVLEKKKAGNFSVHHYCLMNTHFHLAVSIFSKQKVREQLGKNLTMSVFH